MGIYCQICEAKSTISKPCKNYSFKHSFEGIEFTIDIYMHPECVKNTEYKILEFQ